MKMQIKLFIVHDSKAAAYLPPFNLPTTEMAIRTFTDTVNDKQHAFWKHPEDYTLFEIATYDDATGTITTLQSKKPLGNGLDYKFPEDVNLGDCVTKEELKLILEENKK